MHLKIGILFVLALVVGTDGRAEKPKEGFLLNRVIQGGTITTEQSKSWRSVVRLYISGNSTCTGTFIGYRKILTAAHCVNKGSYLTDVTFFKAGSEYTTVSLSKADQKVKVNPDFYDGNYRDDLAVVYLNRSILPSGYYAMNVVSTNEIKSFSDLEGKKVYMLGASHNKMGTLAFAKGVVERAYSSIDVRGDRGKAGICGGDSGGPLVMDTGRELILLGVLAGYHMSYNKTAGDKCTEGGHYSPYTGWASNFFNEQSL
jgi:secreted trypsin-like serine protease